MTIAMIGHKGLPARSGGFERHVSFLAQGLALRGHRVVSYARRWYVGDAPVTLSAGIEQHFTRGIKTKHLDAITHSFTALLHARSLHPDVIHLHGTGVSLLAPLARLLCPRAKVVVTFHCQDAVLAKWNWFAKTAFRLGEWCACHFAHRTIVVSQTLARYCLKKYHCQVAYITHPFIPPTNTPSLSVVERAGLKPKQYFLSVARLIPDKQIHSLIEAYALARKADPATFAQVPLVLVGGGANTESYVARIKRLVSETPGVHFLGERCGEELEALQAHALAHVFPTSSEGLAFTMLEAAGFARPSIVTNLPQNREATGEYALEVRAGDVADLARGLREMLALNPDERDRMGLKAREHLIEKFSFDDRVDDVALLYQELCTGEMSLRSPHSLLEYSLRKT